MIDTLFVKGRDHVVKIGYCRFWAERGLIHVEDERANSYKVIPIRDMLFRIKAVSDMVKRSRQNRADYWDELLQNQRVVDAMIELCKRAQEQGSPDDASARRDLVRRRPKTVLMPRNFGTFKL